MKKLRKLVLLLAVTVMVIGGTLTAHAEEAFDATYYAQTNPDVVQAVGMDANALYQHYVTFGKAEGRKGTPDTSVQTPTTGVNTFVPTAQADFTKYNAEMQKIADETNAYNLQKGYILADSIVTKAGMGATGTKTMRYAALNSGWTTWMEMKAWDANYYELATYCYFTAPDINGLDFGVMNTKAFKLMTKMIGDNDGSLADKIIYYAEVCPDSENPPYDTWFNVGNYQVKYILDGTHWLHWFIRPIQ